MRRRRKRAPISLPPDFIRFVPQNGQDSDCYVSTLGTIFGWTRDEALVICGTVAPQVLATGMDDEEVDRALMQAGARYRRLRPGEYDLHDATGVLTVTKKRGPYHVVVLWAGRIIEGNGEHWLDPNDYFEHYGGTPGELLVREDE